MNVGHTEYYIILLLLTKKQIEYFRTQTNKELACAWGLRALCLSYLQTWPGLGWQWGGPLLSVPAGGGPCCAAAFFFSLGWFLSPAPGWPLAIFVLWGVGWWLQQVGCVSQFTLCSPTGCPSQTTICLLCSTWVSGSGAQDLINITPYFLLRQRVVSLNTTKGCNGVCLIWGCIDTFSQPRHLYHAAFVVLPPTQLLHAPR